MVGPSYLRVVDLDWGLFQLWGSGGWFVAWDLGMFSFSLSFFRCFGF